MKIVICRSPGGYELSHKTIMRYAQLYKMQLYPDDNLWAMMYFKIKPQEFIDLVKKYMIEENNEAVDLCYKHLVFRPEEISRTDLTLIFAILEQEEIEEGSSGNGLKIVEVPDDVQWYIDTDESGVEVVREVHRVWY